MKHHHHNKRATVASAFEAHARSQQSRKAAAPRPIPAAPRIPSSAAIAEVLRHTFG